MNSSPGIESQGHRSWFRVNKDSNAVGLTSILDQGQFVLVLSKNNSPHRPHDMRRRSLLPHMAHAAWSVTQHVSLYLCVLGTVASYAKTDELIVKSANRLLLGTRGTMH